MSSPRLATLVAMRNWIFPARNAARVRVPLALRQAAVQASDVLPAALERGGQPVDADLRVAEDEEPIEPELVGELDERLHLVLLGHEVHDLTDGLDGPQVGRTVTWAGSRFMNRSQMRRIAIRHRRREERRLPIGAVRGRGSLSTSTMKPRSSISVRLVEDDGVDVLDQSHLPAAE